MNVDLGERSYPLDIGQGLLGCVAEICLPKVHPTSVAILSHPRLMRLYGGPVAAGFRSAGIPTHCISVPSGERFKTLRTVERVCRELVQCELDRKSLLVAVGGGVLGDVCGFVAASYLRGISFVQVPTTLLAQVDASIGGKTGVDLPEGKNLIGAFHQPKAVIIDTETLRTLPARELRSGLAEVAKYGIISDDQLFGDLERSVPQLLRRDAGILEQIIGRSCEIKAEVVGQDEREQGLRAILNFGHTIGHALEAVTAYRRYKHGEAVSIGMVSACFIGEEAGVTPREVTAAVRSLLSRFRLPVDFPADIDPDSVISATARDKKRVGGAVSYILAERIGRVRIVSDLSTQLVRRAVVRHQG